MSGRCLGHCSCQIWASDKIQIHTRKGQFKCSSAASVSPKPLSHLPALLLASLSHLRFVFFLPNLWVNLNFKLFFLLLWPLFEMHVTAFIIVFTAFTACLLLTLCRFNVNWKVLEHLSFFHPCIHHCGWFFLWFWPNHIFLIIMVN